MLSSVGALRSYQTIWALIRWNCKVWETLCKVLIPIGIYFVYTLIPICIFIDTYRT
jgi:hypothetical protein